MTRAFANRLLDRVEAASAKGDPRCTRCEGTGIPFGYRGNKPRCSCADTIEQATALVGRERATRKR